MTTGSTPRHVYHVGPWRRWLLAWIFGPVLLGCLAFVLLLPGEGRAIGGWLGLIILVFWLGFQWLIDRSILEVSPAGVRERQTGYTLETSWTNIIEMRLDRGLEAFITREPLQGKGLELLAATASSMPRYDERHLRLLNEHRLIPFEAFAWHLRHGELRAQIQSYAPHLRDALTALDAPAVKAPPLTGSAKLKVVLFVAFCVGVVWLAARTKEDQPLLDSGVGAVLLAAFAYQTIDSARDFLRRRLWIWGGLLAVLGVALALWALAMGETFVRLLRGG